MPKKQRFRIVTFKNPSGALRFRVQGSLPSGVRVRENHASMEAAQTALVQYERDAAPHVLGNQQAVLTKLSPEYIARCELMAELIGGRDPVHAARALLEREPLAGDSRPIRPLIDAFTRHKEATTAFHTHNSVRKLIDLFLRETGIETLKEFNLTTAESWIQGPEIQARTKIKRRSILTSFVTWLAHPKRRLVPKNLLEGLDEIKAGGEPPRRLKAAQVQALMAAAIADTAVEFTEKKTRDADGEPLGKPVRMIHNYALRTFAGLRPSEVLDLAAHPERINLDEGYVFVGDPATRTHRAVKLTESARAWLMWCRENAPEIVFKPRIHERVKAAARVVDIWQPDICRHTFGSFHLRRCRKDHETADEMGNSVRVVRGFYAVPLTDEELTAFDALLPAGWYWGATRLSKIPAERVPVAVRS